MPACRVVEVRGSFATSVDYCGVITVTEHVADGLEREECILTEQIHGDMAGFGNRLDAARSS